MTTSKLVLALLLSAFAAVSFAAEPASTDMPASAAHHGKKMSHHKHAMGAASGASASMK